MRAKLLAAAAIGALFAAPAYAQTDNTTGSGAGAMTEKDMEQLGEAFEKGGFSGFRPVTGGDVFRGMGADGTSAVIAVAPEMGNNTADAGTAGGATGTGTENAEMFQVTTAEGRTLYVVVRPEMTGMMGTDTTATTSDDNNDNDDDAGTTTADADAATTEGETTGNNADATTADNDAGETTGGNTTGNEMTMNVELSGEQQSPPVETDGKGRIDVTFNSETRELSWSLDYSDLSSDATAAHFHGPADPGETAPPVVPVDEFADGAEGSATLTEDQAEQLMAGKWYFNLHTENNPNGEIRGQVTAVQ